MTAPTDPHLDPRKIMPPEGSRVKRVVAVMSGKGGVGKSMVTCLLASALHRAGFSVGILDADITGPSIPHAFGVHGKLTAPEGVLLPAVSSDGLKIVSTNLLIDSEDTPLAWRGPVLTNVVKQLFTDTSWGQIDYLFVDMPPGTADVPLTVFQALPVDGVVVVTSPQDLVEMIVDKAVNLAAEMQVAPLGMVENMASFKCPDCGHEHYLFGEPKGQRIAAERGIPAYASLPIDPALASAADAGRVTSYNADEALADIVSQVKGLSL